MTFITFEGGEGSGKTTQAKLLAESFKKANIEHVLTREPGGTESAELIRKLLLEQDKKVFEPMTELLLINAARYEHAEKLIKPALEVGKTVICDRFVDSTMAYQGFGHKLGKKLPAIFHNYAMNGLSPNITIILDIDPSIGLKRARANSPNLYETFNYEFHERVARGFHEIAKLATERCTLFNAVESIEIIHKKIISHLNNKLNLSLKEANFS